MIVATECQDRELGCARGREKNKTKQPRLILNQLLGWPDTKFKVPFKTFSDATQLVHQLNDFLKMISKFEDDAAIKDFR